MTQRAPNAQVTGTWEGIPRKAPLDIEGIETQLAHDDVPERPRKAPPDIEGIETID